MKSKRIENKIIIIGGDHHNTLAVIRDLGRHKCNIEVLIHGEFASLNNIRVSYSKYAKKRITWTHGSEHDILEWLLDNKGNNNLKPIIFPCSDLAAYTIDIHYTELAKYYILPGFNNNPGLVAYLMDKKHQKEFADENEIPMAKTWVLNNNSGVFNIPIDMVYPCIIKPEISALGKKSDIKICYSMEELSIALEYFLAENYENVIVQQFMKKKYEACAYGCLIDQYKKLGGLIYKVRENSKGSTCFGEFLR